MLTSFLFSVLHTIENTNLTCNTNLPAQIKSGPASFGTII